jgi:hypothetical protein
MASRSVKIAVGVVAVIVVVLVGVVAGIFVFSGSIIKQTVERMGPKMTQTSVTLDTVDLSLTSGEGRMAGLVVGNPKGFTTPTSMKLGEIALKVDTSTITKDTIVIREILIRAPEITYEYGSGGDNITAIKKNVDSYVGPGSSPAAKKGDEPGKKLIIDSLRIQDGKVTAAAMGQQFNTGLPAIQLRDIGKKSNGATVAEVVEQVLAAVQQQVASVASQQGLNKLGGAAQDAAKGALESVTKGTGGAGGAAQDALKGILGK